MTKKDFITGAEFPPEQIMAIIQAAISYKKGGIPHHPQKILTLLFNNPSLRTRLSFESGMKKMKGHVNVISAGDSWNMEYEEGAIMNGQTQEHIKDAARVISGYGDVIGMRKSELITTKIGFEGESGWDELKQDVEINALAKYATVPVINLESNLFHPCQALADMMTLVENMGDLRKKKYVLTWAPHPKPLPLATPHSQLLMPAMLGMDVTLVHPKGFELDEDVMALAQEKSQRAGGFLSLAHDQAEAFKDAEVVVAKSWASLAYFGQWEKEAAYRNQFHDWTVDESKMSLTDNAFFMHCLPVRRNVVVTDAVLDSTQSLILLEAENRMWAQMALLHFLLTNAPHEN